MESLTLLDLIRRIKANGRLVFICGNGGSAATAEHLSNDLFKHGVKAVCLNSNVSLTTMIANDYGYDKIFSKQIELFAGSRDLLITISCSGTSPNIQKAIEVAKLREMPIASLPVFKPESPRKFEDYALLEDEHMRICHQLAIALSKE